MPELTCDALPWGAAGAWPLAVYEVLGLVWAALAGVWLGARLARRGGLMRRPRLVAWLGCGLGFGVAAAGVLCDFTPAARAGFARGELYLAIFGGALLGAVSAMLLARLAGWARLPVRRTGATGAAPDTGYRLVCFVALGLCGWLGYGFISGTGVAPGWRALFAAALLAVSLGIQLAMTVERWSAWLARLLELPAVDVRCAGVLHGPYRHLPAGPVRIGDPLCAAPGDEFSGLWIWRAARDETLRTEARSIGRHDGHGRRIGGDVARRQRGRSHRAAGHR